MIDCNNCKHINMLEKEQRDKREKHICLKYNKRIFHNCCNSLKHEGQLYPCWNCWNDSYVNYEVR